MNFPRPMGGKSTLVHVCVSQQIADQLRFCLETLNALSIHCRDGLGESGSSLHMGEYVEILLMDFMQNMDRSTLSERYLQQERRRSAYNGMLTKYKKKALSQKPTPPESIWPYQKDLPAVLSLSMDEAFIHSSKEWLCAFKDEDFKGAVQHILQQEHLLITPF